jgi:transcriptional regulator with XRE-family HTH domain
VETTIGGRCREARERAALTRDALVQAMAQHGVTVATQTLWRWETGEREPPGYYLQALIDVTGTDPAWLVLGTASPACAKLERIRQILDEPAPSASAEAGALGAVAAVRNLERRRHGRRASDGS